MPWRPPRKAMQTGRGTARAVIGAGYGDEGKGRMTDWICANAGAETVVVRYNGGAQAGHTVCTAQGKRHVFAQIGSGALAGARTFLSRFFVCHPLVFERERGELARIGVEPAVDIDPRALVTTPYDVLINQAMETARGAKRHGSCGMGFGETIERAERGSRIEARDLGDRATLATMAREVRDTYLVHRWEELGLAPIDPQWTSDELLEGFIEECGQMDRWVEPRPMRDAVAHADVVFEGAQGLGLDMRWGQFPHVTRSRTGMHNIAALANEAGIETVEPTYVTRCYATRHGAGRLDNELDESQCKDMVDATNTHNEWQRSIRYGWLDVDKLRRDVRRDVHEGRSVAGKEAIAVTCIDQLEEVTWRESGARRRGRPMEVVESLGASMWSEGPQREETRDEENRG